MRRTLIVGFIGVSLFGCQPQELQDEADLILVNGNVVTVDPDRPRSEAIAVRDDRILGVGSNGEVERLAGDRTRTIDLEGQTVVPGLIDSHMHFPRLGKRTQQLFLDATASPDEVVAIVEREASSAEPGEWITGQGWHTVYWGTESYPDNDTLSRASPHNPVYLVGMASHAAWVNDEALRLAGIDRDTPDPPGGEIVRDRRTGEPTGILLETATDLVAAELPRDTRATRKADIKLSVKTALRLGLTNVHDAGVGTEEIDLYRELLDEGELGVRLYVMYLVPDGGEVLEQYIANPPEIGLGDERLTLRSLKAYVDGALGARGAALLEPYSDSPDDRGLMPNAPEEMYRLVRKAMNAGYQVAIHAIGDRGNRVVLDAIEEAQSELAVQDARPRIEHAQVISPEDIPRFAELGVIASMQPIHCTMDMGFVEPRIGPERARGAYAWRSLLDAGATVIASSDTPAFPVDYTNPLWGIYAAVTRQDNDGQPPGGWYPKERVSRMEALEMYTIDAAYGAFQEEILGSITPGKLADLTVLSKDIMSVPAPEILDTEVVMTIVGGEVLYSKEGS